MNVHEVDTNQEPSFKKISDLHKIGETLLARLTYMESAFFSLLPAETTESHLISESPLIPTLTRSKEHLKTKSPVEHHPGLSVHDGNLSGHVPKLRRPLSTVKPSMNVLLTEASQTSFSDSNQNGDIKVTSSGNDSPSGLPQKSSAIHFGPNQTPTNSELSVTQPNERDDKKGSVSGNGVPQKLSSITFHPNFLQEFFPNRSGDTNASMTSERIFIDSPIRLTRGLNGVNGPTSANSPSSSCNKVKKPSPVIFSSSPIKFQKRRKSDDESIGGFSFEKFLADHKFRPGLKTIRTKLAFEVPHLNRPIGIAVLPKNRVAVSSAGRHEVGIYNSSGNCLNKLQPTRPFKRPTDMAILPQGRLAVRDDIGVQIFDDKGCFLRHVGQDIISSCYGLTTDGRGHLIAIHVGRQKTPPSTVMTKFGETDIVFFDIESGKIKRRIEMVDVIENSKKSKCRFLACDGKKLYVVDLGLDRIYVVNIADPTDKPPVQTFGGTGNDFGKFREPAGIIVDKFGNIIIADAGNHRLQIFDKKWNFLGMVHTTKPLRRPSGLALDETSSVLYVLNLWSNCLLKFELLQSTPQPKNGK